jgi:PAS domain S-box-containing protein
MSDLFIPDDMQEAHETGMKRYLREGKAQVVGKGRLELSAVRRSGERFPVELAVAEAREAEGGEPIFVGFMRDISQRKAAEADLMEARDAAMAADRAK